MYAVNKQFIQMHFSHLGSRSRIWCTIGRATGLAIIIIESIKIQLKTVGFHKICWYSVEKLSIDLAIHAYPAPSDKGKKKNKNQGIYYLSEYGDFDDLQARLRQTVTVLSPEQGASSRVLSHLLLRQFQ